MADRGVGLVDPPADLLDAGEDRAAEQAQRGEEVGDLVDDAVVLGLLRLGDPALDLLRGAAVQHALDRLHQIVQRVLEALAAAVQDAERHPAGAERSGDRVEPGLRIAHAEPVEHALHRRARGVAELLQQRTEAALEEARDLREVLAQELHRVDPERARDVAEIEAVALVGLGLDAERPLLAALGGGGRRVGLGLDRGGAIGRRGAGGVADPALRHVDRLVDPDLAAERVVAGRLVREADRGAGGLAQPACRAEVGAALDGDVSDRDARGALDGLARRVVERGHARRMRARVGALMAARVLDQRDHALRDVLAIGTERPPCDPERAAVLVREAVDVLAFDRHADRAQQIADRGHMTGIGGAARGDVVIADCRRLVLGGGVPGDAGIAAGAWVASCASSQSPSVDPGAYAPSANTMPTDLEGVLLMYAAVVDCTRCV